MEVFEIKGGNQLSGEIRPQGSKNESLQVLCAVLLTEEEVILHNIPEIRDVQNQIRILQGLGVEISLREKGTIAFRAKDINLDYLQSEEFRYLSGFLRGSIMILGPLLARVKQAYIYQPGGDKIGRRKIDVHLQGLQALGTDFNYDHHIQSFSLKTKGLQGTYIHLDEPSVTGTANVIMAAVLADGETVIYNAACEPYIQQTCLLLNSMGAKILGIGSNLLTIQGVKTLKGATHTVLPDMIEIGSWMALAAMTQSQITIKGVAYPMLGLIPKVFSKMGVIFEQRGEDIFLQGQENYEIETNLDGSIMTIYDGPWPCFTADLLSVILVMATQARGTVLIHQKMFESRLFFVDKLIDMGAQIIICDPHRATVIGLDRKIQLRAKTLESPDIRAGIALLIAALSAKGTSTIGGIYQIDRGYECIDKRLRALGADICRKIL